MPATTMTEAEPLAAIRVDLGAIFVSLELSKSTWLVTALAPGSEKMSRYNVVGGDLAGLFVCFVELRRKVQARTGKLYPLVVIQESGLDGFWIDRAIRQEEWIESHVVDAASIAVSRRNRRAKTDRLDGEVLVRTLMAYKRGEPRACSMVRVPSVGVEDRRRICRERKVLVAERVLHVNRIKGLLFSQGIRDYEPLRRDRRASLEVLYTGDGRLLPDHLKAQVSRELDRLELLLEQIKVVEAERDALITEDVAVPTSPVLLLQHLKGIGPEFAAVLATEGLCRHFDNRRQLAAYAGLAASPWRSGQINREQGISKSGNPRLRTTMIQLAWLWIRHQPDTALTLWFMLGDWAAFTAFLNDGRICLTNNCAERALRGIALGRKAWLFAGSDRGGQRAAFMFSLITTARLNDIDPQAWLADVLARIADIPQHRLHELLPWHWQALRTELPVAA